MGDRGNLLSFWRLHWTKDAPRSYVGNLPGSPLKRSQTNKLSSCPSPQYWPDRLNISFLHALHHHYWPDRLYISLLAAAKPWAA